MQVLCIDMSRCKGGAGVFALAEYLPLMDGSLHGMQPKN